MTSHESIDQPGLPGFGAARPQTLHNVFFALVPDEASRRAIAAAARQIERDLRPRGRWIKPARFHLTLHYLGTFSQTPQGLIISAIEAAQRVRVDAFELVLDRMGSFRNRSVPLWLGASTPPHGLIELHDALRTALFGAGAKPAAGPGFAAHVTILRDADRAIATAPIAPIRWRVDEFVLIDSVLGAQSEHIVRGRWRLGEAP
ncbi:MAG TPA: RNA 2',3'-cyclic phosphodiesterase [Rudaea sp.]